MTETDQTVTYWIEQLKCDDPQAARVLFDLYFRRLIGLARHKLGSVPPRVVDPEDVAVSVFESLCLGAVKGNFPLLTNRECLWRLLVTITHQKTVDHIRRCHAGKRGGGKVRGDSVFINAGQGEPRGFDDCPGEAPEPEFLAMLQEQYEHLLSLLRNDELRRIAQARLEGKTTTEIAEELQVSKRSVERKLNLIRKDWETELSG